MNNFLQALPFYREMNQMGDCQCPGQGFDPPTFKLYTKTGQIPPFSLRLPMRGSAPDITYAAECVQVLDCDNVPVAMVSAPSMPLRLYKDATGYYLVYDGSSQTHIPMECGGCYRLKVDEYFSQVFWATDTPENKVSIELSNSSQLGDVPYQTGLIQSLLVDASLCNIEPELFESRKTEANGRETITYQKQTLRRVLNIDSAPTFITELLSAFPLHDSITVSHKGEQLVTIKKRNTTKTAAADCCRFDVEIVLALRDIEIAGGNCQTDTEAVLVSLPLLPNADELCGDAGEIIWTKTGNVLCLPFGESPPTTPITPVGTPPVVDTCPPNGRQLSLNNIYTDCSQPWVKDGVAYRRKQVRVYADGNCGTYTIDHYLDPCEVITPPVGTPPVGTPPVGTPPVGTPPVGTPPPDPTCERVRELVYKYTHATDTLDVYYAPPEDLALDYTAYIILEEQVEGDWVEVLAETSMTSSSVRSFKKTKAITGVEAGVYRLSARVLLTGELAEDEGLCVTASFTLTDADTDFIYMRLGQCYAGPTILGIRNITSTSLDVDFNGLHVYSLKYGIRNQALQVVYVGGEPLEQIISPGSGTINIDFGGVLPPGNYYVGLGGINCIGNSVMPFTLSTPIVEDCPTNIDATTGTGAPEENANGSIKLFQSVHYMDYSVAVETGGTFPHPVRVEYAAPSANVPLGVTVGGNSQIVTLPGTGGSSNFVWSDPFNVIITDPGAVLRLSGAGNLIRIKNIEIGCSIEGGDVPGCDDIQLFAYAYQFGNRRLDLRAKTTGFQGVTLNLERQVGSTWLPVFGNQVMDGTNVAPFSNFYIRTGIDPAPYRVLYRTPLSGQSGCTEPFTLPASDVAMTYLKGVAPPVGTPPVGTPPVGTPPPAQSGTGIRTLDVGSKRYNIRGAQDVDFGFNSVGVVDNGQYTIDSGGKTFKAYYTIDGTPADSTVISALQGAGYAIEPDYPYSFEKRWVDQALAATQTDLDNQGGDLFVDTAKNLGSAQIIVHWTSIAT